MSGGLPFSELIVPLNLYSSVLFNGFWPSILELDLVSTCVHRCSQVLYSPIKLRFPTVDLAWSSTDFSWSIQRYNLIARFYNLDTCSVLPNSLDKIPISFSIITQFSQFSLPLYRDWHLCCYLSCFNISSTGRYPSLKNYRYSRLFIRLFCVCSRLFGRQSRWFQSYHNLAKSNICILNIWLVTLEQS